MTNGLPARAAGYDLVTMPPTETSSNSLDCRAHLREVLRCAASALKHDAPRFALAGSYALWAYGAPEPSHDVDLVVAEPDVATATATLRAAGFAIENPPEDWLFKARIGETLVDVLHRLNGEPVDSAILECAEQRDVLAIAMPVLPPTMVLVQKLRALHEHHCDWRVRPRRRSRRPGSRR